MGYQTHLMLISKIQSNLSKVRTKNNAPALVVVH
ncbi:hypothetical protein SA3033_05705 [Aggregatibacter actinomycetemcomitans serotype d str. SA3033]|nr:hypothetical protein SA3033_05705 [Aggregatibacter actinomycetemcomitans serotype d str. SA3033]KYK88364.1 hypothetical protein SA2200_04640 [Aggregatibacter actinomycetemcomitans serotype d str. SA2200]KYK90885.1 hypothetical protein SA508_02150 [Aggregatibacter actinomycetemcomitans serotype d str. SA508]KYK91697.1 hypothetical protein SA269_09180 [Aggregatibacter actinomycetemcomitans serotype d str. SA269]KYK95695.1 hypothetical protein SA3733_04130 [Aggregatibacter actinomycetemcomitans